MKLRNKKTGKVIEWFNNTDGVFPNSLAELNEEYEDYKEPKEHYSITQFGEVIDDVDVYSSETIDEMKHIGNYFETEEEAEKAVEKLKAWKRLKNNGFRFEYYDYSDRDLHNHIQIKAITNRELEDSMVYKNDLDLLFGGEE